MSISLYLLPSVLSFPVHTHGSGGDGVLPEFVKIVFDLEVVVAMRFGSFPFASRLYQNGQHHSFKADEIGLRLGA